VMKEFFTQGDAERAFGRLISLNCDRYDVVVPKAQVGFISFLVAPLYKALHAYSPSLGELVEQLEYNRKHFEQRTQLATFLRDVDAIQLSVRNAEEAPLLRERPFPPSPSKSNDGKELLEAVKDWDFDVFSLPYDELPAVVYCVIIAHPAVAAASCDLDLRKLYRYVCEIAARYHPHPFHSFRHAVDVVLATSYLIRVVEQDHPDMFSDPIHITSLLIGALVHDTDHPAVMNPYLVATNHPIATALGDSPRSVLEKHHAAVALALLDRPELDFLCDAGDDLRTQYLDFIRMVVLNTDAASTIAVAKRFSDRVEAFNLAQSSAPSEARSLYKPLPSHLMCLIIKAADISNPARKLNLYEKWIDGVMKEFFMQGDAERAQGIPISINCDRETASVPKAQVGFISFLVAPLYRALHAYSPSLAPLVAQLEQNERHFASLVPQSLAVQAPSPALPSSPPGSPFTPFTPRRHSATYAASMARARLSRSMSYDRTPQTPISRTPPTPSSSTPQTPTGALGRAQGGRSMSHQHLTVRRGTLMDNVAQAAEVTPPIGPPGEEHADIQGVDCAARI